MRKIGFILSFLLIASLSFSQVAVKGIVASSQQTAASPTYNSTYQAIYDEFVNPPSSSVASAQNTMVGSLVDGGYWAEFDRFVVTAQEYNSAGEALIDWAHPTGTAATNVSSTVWTSLEGFTGDGIADRINLNYNPSTDAVNYTQSDASFGVYSRIDQAEDAALIGVDGSYDSYVEPRQADGFARYRMNSFSEGTSSTGYSDGLFAVSRTHADTVRFYSNGSLVAAGTQTSHGVSNADYFLLSNGGTDFSTNQISVAWVGGGFYPSAMAEINTIIEAYMDAIGKGVQ